MLCVRRHEINLNFVCISPSECLDDQMADLIFYPNQMFPFYPDQNVSPSLKHFEVTIGLLTGPISILLCLSRNRVAQGRENDGRATGGVKTQHSWIKFALLYGCSLWFPQPITIVTSEITDHSAPHKYNSNKSLKCCEELPNSVTETQNKQMLLGKWC